MKRFVSLLICIDPRISLCRHIKHDHSDSIDVVRVLMLRLPCREIVIRLFVLSFYHELFEVAKLNLAAVLLIKHDSEGRDHSVSGLQNI